MSARQSSIDSLTPREVEVLTMIAEGDSLMEIAQKIHRSLKTVESHRLSLGRKLKASNRVELTKIAIARGLIQIQSAASEPTRTELDYLNRINDTVYNTTGQEFLQRFCQAASRLPGVEIAALCTTDRSVPPGDDPLNRVVLASARRGEQIEPMRYHAANTPCHEVIEAGICRVTGGVHEAYPEDPWLKAVNADSYIGLRLTDANGQHVGGIALIGLEPMEDADTLCRALEFFVPRLSAVMQTVLEIKKLLQQNEQLGTRRMIADPLTVAATHLAGVGSPSSAALAQVLRAVQPLAGAQFLHGLVDALCETFGTNYVGICQIDGTSKRSTRLHSVIFRANGEQQDPIAYEAAGSPCALTLREGLLSVPHDAAKKFPDDQFFVDHKIESYVGIKTPNSSGDAAGVTWLVDPRPLTDPKAIEVVLSYFAPRIGAELELLGKYEGLAQETEKMASELSEQ